MKKLLFLSALMLTLAFTSIAQGVEFTPFAGYTFGDRFNIRGGTARIGDGFTYGGFITFHAGDHNAVELTYMRQDMFVTANSSFITIMNSPASSNYIMLGGSRLFPVSDKLTPFAGFNVGIGVYGSRNNTFDNFEKLAFGLVGGVKIFLNERIGIRLQSNLNFPLTNVGGAFWWSSGGGTSVGVTGSIPFVQFGFNGGLIFKLQ